MSSHQNLQEIQQLVLEPIGTDTNTPHEPFIIAHSHLVNITHLARQCYDDIITNQARYQQAFIMERGKLTQNVEAYKQLAVEHERLQSEIGCCRAELHPRYDQLIIQQGKEIQDLRNEIQDIGAKRHALVYVLERNYPSARV